jgi:methyl-accepting chemotaxis protein
LCRLAPTRERQDVLKLYQRILLAPGLALLFLLLFGVVVYRALSTDQVAMREIFSTRFGIFQKADQALADIDAAHAAVYRLVTWIGSYDPAKIAHKSAELTGKIDGATAIVKGLAGEARLTDEEKGHLEAILAHLANYRKHEATAVDLASVDVNTGLAALQTADITYQELRGSLDALIDLEKRLAQRRYDEALATYQSAFLLASVVFVSPSPASPAASSLAPSLGSWAASRSMRRRWRGGWRRESSPWPSPPEKRTAPAFSSP